MLLMLVLIPYPTPIRVVMIQQLLIILLLTMHAMILLLMIQSMIQAIRSTMLQEMIVQVMIPRLMIHMMIESMLLQEVDVVSLFGGPIILCILMLIVDQLNCTMFILE
jgi:hypothetical protein